MYRSILQARSTQTKRGKVTETNQEWLLSEEMGTRNNVLVCRAPEQSRDTGTLSGARRSFFIWVLRPCICPSLADFQSSDFIAGVCPRPVPEVRTMPELRTADENSSGSPRSRLQQATGLHRPGNLPPEQKRWLVVLQHLLLQQEKLRLGLKGCSFPGEWKRPPGALEPNPFGIITLTHLGSRWLQGLFHVPGRRKGSLLPETAGGARS